MTHFSVIFLFPFIFFFTEFFTNTVQTIVAIYIAYIYLQSFLEIPSSLPVTNVTDNVEERLNRLTDIGRRHGHGRQIKSWRPKRTRLNEAGHSSSVAPEVSTVSAETSSLLIRDPILNFEQVC